MAVRILHCSDSLNNYNLCIKNEVTGFTNKTANEGDLIYLLVRYQNKTYCSARFVLGEETNSKPWPDSERFSLARKSSKTEFCLPFDFSVIKNITGPNWAVKYVQNSKEIKNDDLVFFLDNMFRTNKSENNIEINEENLLKYNNQVIYNLESLPLEINNQNDEYNKVELENTKEKIYEITNKNLNWNKLVVYKTNSGFEYNLENCVEYTYMILDQLSDSVKIGKTTNTPEQRLSQLKTGNPNLKLLISYPSSLYSEKFLHKKFYESHKSLEFFHNTKSLQKFIQDSIEKEETIYNAFSKKNELSFLESKILFP